MKFRLNENSDRHSFVVSEREICQSGSLLGYSLNQCAFLGVGEGWGRSYCEPWAVLAKKTNYKLTRQIKIKRNNNFSMKYSCLASQNTKFPYSLPTLKGWNGSEYVVRILFGEHEISRKGLGCFNIYDMCMQSLSLYKSMCDMSSPDEACLIYWQILTFGSIISMKNTFLLLTHFSTQISMNLAQLFLFTSFTLTL